MFKKLASVGLVCSLLLSNQVHIFAQEGGTIITEPVTEQTEVVKESEIIVENDSKAKIEDSTEVVGKEEADHEDVDNKLKDDINETKLEMESDTVGGDDNFLEDFTEKNRDEQISYICSIMQKDIKDLDLVEELKDIDGNPLYLLVTFKTEGYAVLINGCNYSVEYTEKGQNPYVRVVGEKYYLGPLQYFYNEGGSLHNVITKEIITDDDMWLGNSIKAKVLEIKNKSQETGDVSSNFESKQANPYEEILVPYVDEIENMYFGDNVGTDINPHGTCGILASSMMLTYYDRFIKNNFLPKNLELVKHYDDTLHEELINNYQVGATLGGSFPSDDAQLLSLYIGQNGYIRNGGYQANSSLISTQGLIQSIIEGRPGLIYTVFNEKYEKHTMLAYGYKLENGIGKFKIHTGWHDRDLNTIYCQREGSGDICDHTNGPWIDSGLLLIGGSTWLEKYEQHNHDFSEWMGVSDIGDKPLMKCKICDLLTEDDYPNNMQYSIMMDYGTTTSGKINYSGDVDWFKIDAPYKGGYTVRTVGKNMGNGTMYLNLYSEKGNLIYSWQGGDMNKYLVLEKGVYYLRVASSLVTVNYTVEIRKEEGVK